MFLTSIKEIRIADFGNIPIDVLEEIFSHLNAQELLQEKCFEK